MNNPDRNAGATKAGFTRVGPADARTVTRFRHELEQWLRAHFHLDAVRLNDVLLAANEALTNAAEFAYLGALQHGTMTMRGRYRAADGSLSIVVSDRGRWRQTDTNVQSNLRGRGIPLMQALADRMSISRKQTGTEVQLEFDGFLPVTAKPYATTA
jgi:serine/threonine-protein kinase RsbW